MVKSIFLTISLLFMVGCTSLLEVEEKEQERTRLDIEEPTAPELSELNWVIITPDNADKVFSELETPVLFGLTGDMYQNLAINNTKTRNYIIQVRQILQLYKDYYESTEKQKN